MGFGSRWFKVNNRKKERKKELPKQEQEQNRKICCSRIVGGEEVTGCGP